MPGTYLTDESLWVRKGRAPIFPPGYDDGFVIGTTIPTTSNTGALAETAGTRTVYTGSYDFHASADPANPTVLEHVIFTRPLRIRSGYCRIFDFEATNTDLVAPTTETALIYTMDSGVKEVILERGTFDPGEAGAHHNLNAVTGHHTTVRRCLARRVVDFVGSFNNSAPVVNNVIEGNLLEWLVYFYSPTLGVVHPSDYRTHNDGIQHQGGSGLIVRGNKLHGIVRYKDGVTIPTDQGGQPWEGLAHQGVLCQQNVQKATAINPVVENNWLYGFQHAFVFKTDADGSGNLDGTPYDTVFTGNLVDDVRRYYGTSSDYYGVAGGRPYVVRLDRVTTINGTEYDYPLPAYPEGSGSSKQSSTEYQASGDNRYFNNTSVGASARRGQLITVRRDNFYGG